jgi:hypothetical protein
VIQHYQDDGPVKKAAKMALETGNANYILIWDPEKAENHTEKPFRENML